MASLMAKLSQELPGAAWEHQAIWLRGKQAKDHGNLQNSQDYYRHTGKDSYPRPQYEFGQSGEIFPARENTPERDSDRGLFRGHIPDP